MGTGWMSGKGRNMRIETGNLQMSSARRYRSELTSSTSEYAMTFTSGLAAEEFRQTTQREVTQERSGDMDLLQKEPDQYSNCPVYTRKMLPVQEQRENFTASVRQRCIMHMLKFFFQLRKKYENQNGFDRLDDLFGNSRMLPDYQTAFYEQEMYYSETEQAAFTAEGTVRTADGRELSFQMNVQMSRSFQTYYHVSYETAQSMCDPLVINMDTDAAGLSDQTFYFDLDGDGKVDNIHELQKGSGYLAVDRNENGKIDNGTELFGTKSGDGFGDLSEYDTDHNGWIDENDPIWQKLRIWVRDDSGKNELYTMQQSGVGAICLSSEKTEFSLNSQNRNETEGVVRKTGIFLFENGEAGTIQHLDLAR